MTWKEIADVLRIRRPEEDSPYGYEWEQMTLQFCDSLSDNDGFNEKAFLEICNK